MRYQPLPVESMLHRTALIIFEEAIAAGLSVTFQQVQDTVSREHAELVKKGRIELLWDEDHGMMSVLTEEGAKYRDHLEAGGEMF